MQKFSIAVLAGGMSRRFGSDKSMAEISGKKLYEICLEKALDISDDVMLISKDSSKFQTDTGVRKIIDEEEVQCPLNGIYTALKHSKYDNVFVVSVDSPLFSVKSVAAMFQHAGDTSCIYPEIEGKAYPVYAFYSKNMAEKLKSELDAGNFRLYKIIQAMGAKNLNENFFLKLNGNLDEFANFNTPEELEKVINKKAHPAAE